jgi:hypothetical protein
MPTVAQLAMKFPACYRTPRFITVFPRAQHCTCLQARGVEEKKKLEWILNKKFWEKLSPTSFWYIWAAQQMTRSTILLLLRVYSSPSRCLATIEEYTLGQRLMGWIYKIPRWDGLRGHEIRAKFNKDWFWHSKFDGGYIIHKQHVYHISLMLFFQNKESRLKNPSEGLLWTR